MRGDNGSLERLKELEARSTRRDRTSRSREERTHLLDRCGQTGRDGGRNENAKPLVCGGWPARDAIGVDRVRRERFRKSDQTLLAQAYTV